MNPTRRFSFVLVMLSSAFLLPAPIGLAQPGGGGPSGLPPGVTREQMWPAPTAEDWKKPCLVQWQRTWDDAVAVSRETKKPILVCVNMDGEIASEHYAGVRYRQPEIAKLYEPYVCVIASVYRHNPRDYDEQGRRLPCPRFGTVTCGEHIAIEPILYEKFMDGRRIAPRHIGVELDGKEMYDVFFAWDTDTIFNSLKKGIADRSIQSVPAVRGDRSIFERVASRDSVDRDAVEAAYEQGDRNQRHGLLEAALAHNEAAPTDLLRLGVFGLDVELSQLATSSPTRCACRWTRPSARRSSRRSRGSVRRRRRRGRSRSCTAVSRPVPRRSTSSAGRRRSRAGPPIRRRARGPSQRRLPQAAARRLPGRMRARIPRGASSSRRTTSPGR
jgi:hypothetical protein